MLDFSDPLRTISDLIEPKRCGRDPHTDGPPGSRFAGFGGAVAEGNFS
jgi:hypothetical protein